MGRPACTVRVSVDGFSESAGFSRTWPQAIQGEQLPESSEKTRCSQICPSSPSTVASPADAAVHAGCLWAALRSDRPRWPGQDPSPAAVRHADVRSGRERRPAGAFNSGNRTSAPGSRSGARCRFRGVREEEVTKRNWPGRTRNALRIVLMQPLSRKCVAANTPNELRS
jgi:hypothetical protein